MNNPTAKPKRVFANWVWCIMLLLSGCGLGAAALNTDESRPTQDCMTEDFKILQDDTVLYIDDNNYASTTGPYVQMNTICRRSGAIFHTHEEVEVQLSGLVATPTKGLGDAAMGVLRASDWFAKNKIPHEMMHALSSAAASSGTGHAVSIRTLRRGVWATITFCLSCIIVTAGLMILIFNLRAGRVAPMSAGEGA